MTVSRFLVGIWVPTHRTVVTAKVFILVEYGSSSGPPCYSAFPSHLPLIFPLPVLITWNLNQCSATIWNTGTSNESYQPIPHERFTYRVLTRFPPIIFPIVNVTTRGLVIDYTHGFSPISFPIGLGK